ncbi:MAG: aspartate/glutamate racemase family protein [Candidatus Bathyarchaeota archaeon]
MSRIGLLLPSSNTTMEPDFVRMAPDGVTVHSARMLLEDVTPVSLERMAGEAEQAARLLSTADVDLMVYGCTSGSLIRGVEWEESLVQRIEAASDTPTVTTAGAVVEALRAIGARKIWVFTPYADPINRLEKTFLEAHGFQVASIRGLGLVDNLKIGRVTSAEIERLVDPGPGADCLFISCTNLPAVPLVQALEERHQKPVVTSNQASMWAALKRLGKPGVEGYGNLLRIN